MCRSMHSWNSAPFAPGSTIVAPTEVLNSPLDDVDRLVIGLREQPLVHELADDSNPDPVEAGFFCETRIAFLRNPADAVDREIVRWIVTGNDIEHARDVFNGAARGAVAVIEPAASDHAVTAHQAL